MNGYHLMVGGLGVFSMVLSVGTVAVRQRPRPAPLTRSEAWHQRARAPLPEDRTEVGGGTRRLAFDSSSPEVPLALTSVHKLNREHWIDDMEIEVENRSNRPVYHV